jgi:hypothetical protein
MEQKTQEIRTVLKAFQDGYIARDISALDGFMTLFAEEGQIEVIGTSSHTKGQGEWCLDTESLRELIKTDWESWGDLRLDFDGADIHTHGHVGWLAAAGTVSMQIEPEQSYKNYIKYMRWVTENEPEVSAKEKILDILRGGIHTITQAGRGASYIWPIWLTAVLVKEGSNWKFVQMSFSFPTFYPPDIRLVE